MHAFDWLEDSEIGELPPGWNHLVGISDSALPIKLMHYTLGGPWFGGWVGGPFDELWIEEKDWLIASRQCAENRCHCS